MSLSIGIVGLPNVGKSTLFNALTQKSVPAENYPFCTIDPSVGIVAVPDERLGLLADFSHSEKKIPAVVEFVDIAGLVKGASSGEGLGNKFLANIREVDVILHIVRIFEINDSTGTEQTHVYGSINPLRDINIINMELILADMETVQSRLTKIARDVKHGNSIAKKEYDVCHKIFTALENEDLAKSVDFSDEERTFARNLHLLTMKPVIYGLNKKTGGNNLDDIHRSQFREIIHEITESGSEYVVIDAKTEHDLSEFENEEKNMMKKDLGHRDDGVDVLIQRVYSLLDRITYFTTGDKETRAWTVKIGATAPKAGAVIHSDFEIGFIKADVIEWKTLLNVGSFVEARAKGLLRTEGKGYLVQDGDVIEFKI